MAKQSKEIIEDDEPEAWEYEHSIELACDFIQTDILPLLAEFEFNNEDTNYIDGSATHALFVTLLQSMSNMGYTPQDLKDEIDTYMNSSVGEVLH